MPENNIISTPSLASGLTPSTIKQNSFNQSTEPSLASGLMPSYKEGSMAAPGQVQTGLSAGTLRNYIPNISGLNLNTNFEDQVAQAQSNWEVAGRTAIRLPLDIGLKTLQSASFLGAGLIGGIDSLTGNNLEEGFVFKNSLVNGLADAQEKLKEQLKVYGREDYYTGDLLDKIGTAKFYADDVADGISFLASSVLLGYGLGSVAKLGTAARFATNALSKGMTALGEEGAILTEVGQVAAQGGNVAKYGRVLSSGFKSILSDAGQALAKVNGQAIESWGNYQSIVALQSAAESFTEGHSNYKTIKSELEYKNSLLPDDQKLTAEQIDKLSIDGGKRTVIGDMAFLMVTNQFDVASRLFKPKSNPTKLIEDIAESRLSKKGIKLNTNLEGQLDDASQLALNKEIGNINKRAIWKSTAPRLLLSPASETFEELSQYSLQKTFAQIALSGNPDPSMLGDIIPGLIDNYKNAFNDVEGQESMLLGGVLGLLGSYHSAREVKDEFEHGKAISDEIANRSILSEVTNAHILKNTDILNAVNNAKESISKDITSKKISDKLKENIKIINEATDVHFPEDILTKLSNGKLDMNVDGKALKDAIDRVDINAIKESINRNSYLDLGRQLASNAIAIDNIKSLKTDVYGTEFNAKLKDKIVGVDTTDLTNDELISRNKRLADATDSIRKGIALTENSYNLLNNQVRFANKDLNYSTLLTLANMHSGNEYNKVKYQDKVNLLNNEINKVVNTPDFTALTESFTTTQGIDLNAALSIVANDDVIKGLGVQIAVDKDMPNELKEGVYNQLSKLHKTNGIDLTNSLYPEKKLSISELRSIIENSPSLNGLLKLYANKASYDIMIKGTTEVNSNYIFNKKVQDKVQEDIKLATDVVVKELTFDLHAKIESVLGTVIYTKDGKIDPKLYEEYVKSKVAEGKAEEILNELTSIIDLLNNNDNAVWATNPKYHTYDYTKAKTKFLNDVKDLIGRTKQEIKKASILKKNKETDDSTFKDDSPTIDGTTIKGTNNKANENVSEDITSYNSIADANVKITNEITDENLRANFIDALTKVSNKLLTNEKEIEAIREKLLAYYKDYVSKASNAIAMEEAIGIVSGLLDKRTIVYKAFNTYAKDALTKSNLSKQSIEKQAIDLLNKLDKNKESKLESDIEIVSFDELKNTTDLDNAIKLYNLIADYNSWEILKDDNGKVIKASKNISAIIKTLTKMNKAPLSDGQLLTIEKYHNLLKSHIKNTVNFPITLQTSGRQNYLTWARDWTIKSMTGINETDVEQVNTPFEETIAIDKTGGTKVASIFMPFAKDTKIGFNDKGEAVIEDADVDKYKVITSIEEGSTVQVKVNKEYEGVKAGYKELKNDKDKLPIHIVKDGIEIGFIPTQVDNHFGLQYDLSDIVSTKDWTSVVSQDGKDAIDLINNLDYILQLHVASRSISEYKKKLSEITDVSVIKFITDLINKNSEVVELASKEGASRIDHIGLVLFNKIRHSSVEAGKINIEHLRHTVKDWRSKLSRDKVNYANLREFMFRNQDVNLTVPVAYVSQGDVAYNGNEELNKITDALDVTSDEVDVYIVDKADSTRIINPITKEVINTSPNGYSSSVFFSIKSNNGKVVPMYAIIDENVTIDYKKLESNEPFGKYKSYKDYLLNTGAIKTNVTRLVNSKGETISRTFLRSPNTTKTRNLILTIDLSQLPIEKDGKLQIESVSDNVMVTYQLDKLFVNTGFTGKAFDNIKQRISDLILNHDIKVDLITSHKGDTRYDDAYAIFNPTNNTIELGNNWDNSNSITSKAFHVLHEFIHAYIKAKIYNKEESAISFQKDLIAFNEEFAKQYALIKDTLTDFERNAIEGTADKPGLLEIIKGEPEEIITYALSNNSINSVLSKMPSTTGVKGKSLLTDLLELIRTGFKNLFKTNLEVSKIDDLINLVHNYVIDNTELTIDVNLAKDTTIDTTPKAEENDAVDLDGRIKPIDTNEYDNLFESKIDMDINNSFGIDERINYFYNNMTNPSQYVNEEVDKKTKYCI